METLQCARCQTSFERRSAQGRRPRFCSVLCMRRAMKRVRRQTAGRRVCCQCGIEFDWVVAECVPGPVPKHCSIRCRDVRAKRHQSRRSRRAYADTLASDEVAYWYLLWKRYCRGVVDPADVMRYR